MPYKKTSSRWKTVETIPYKQLRDRFSIMKLFRIIVAKISKIVANKYAFVLALITVGAMSWVGMWTLSFSIATAYFGFVGLVYKKSIEKRFFISDSARYKIEDDFDSLGQDFFELKKDVEFIKAHDRNSGSRIDSETLTHEIGLLSGIVRQLADVIAAQESQINKLEENLAEIQSSIVTHNAAAESKKIIKDRKPFVSEAIDKMVATDRVFERARTKEILDAVDGGNIEIWLQPIVNLPQRKVVAYEAVQRLRYRSELLERKDFADLLIAGDRSVSIDRLMVQKIRRLSEHLAGRGSGASVSYTLMTSSKTGLSRIASDDDIPVLSRQNETPGIELGITLEAWRHLATDRESVLKRLGEGASLFLDNPHDLRFDGRQLKGHGIRQIRIPAEMLLRSRGEDNVSDIAVEDLVPMLRRFDIEIVSTGVEVERDVADLIELEIPFAQGDVLMTARAVRPELLVEQSTEVEIPAQTTMPASEQEPPARKSFRDFLRRAS